MVAVGTHMPTSCMAVVSEEAFPVLNSRMAVVLEEVGVIPVATAGSSCMAVVLEEVVPTCSLDYQTWFCRIIVHSCCYLQHLQVFLAAHDT